MNDLKNDDRPLTAFILDLRALWQEQGSPPLTRLATKTGYGQPRLSELFNARRIPDEEFLNDLVTALGGDDKEKAEELREEWAARLKKLHKDEQEFQKAAARNGDSPEAQIARLQDEIKRLTQVTEQPGSVIAQAVAAEESAAQRGAAAAALEKSARALLRQAEEQFGSLHDRMSEAERRGAAIIAEAVASATRHEFEGRKLQERIVAEAHRRADVLVREAEVKAVEIMQSAEERAKEHRATAYQSVSKTLQEVDQLRVEAEQEVEQAQTRKNRLETRAKIEIEQLVREAQRHLEKAGASSQVHALDLLLLDFGITGSHTATRGRHARRVPPTREALPGENEPVAELIIQPPRPDWTGWGFPRLGR
ncbi:hypothetical protein ACFZB4_42385 [Streptomyces pseudovenezuelae]|uniref:hypothetical protein n=1 Tax=Streptomyces pseudovenezuelae TaxID=67350 RepID=UPI0036E3D5BE